MVRVCVLARACPGSWVDHYIAAFRRCCDTLVVGPPCTEDELTAWGRLDVPAQAPDVARDFADFHALTEVLPQGWVPDLVVGISGLGGQRGWPGVALLPCPTALITVDTWQCLLDYPEARNYDYVFAAQREFVPHLEATGSPRVRWLPLACDPAAHTLPDCEPTHDVAFAGSFSAPVHAERQRMLVALAERFTVNARENVFGEELKQVFATGRLTFNHVAVQELNMRVFEGLAMGRGLLTNRDAEVNGLFDLFEDGRHLLVYGDEEELLARTAEYLADDAARSRVAEAGKALVLAEHTYDHRVRTLLDTVGPVPPPREGRYQGEHLRDYLPTAPGVVIDYGLVLGASRVALRHFGATQLVGVGLGADMGHRGSFDAYYADTPGEDLDADTVVVSAAGRGAPFVETALRRAHARLRPGGTVVLRLDPARAPGDVSSWLHGHGFHLRLQGPPLADGGVVVQARKWTRPLREIVAAVHGRLRVPGLDLPELLRRIPETW